MPSNKIKVVFDCNIIWQSFFFGGGVSAKCKQLVDDCAITLLLSPAVLEECREVMTRPEFLEKFKTVSESLIERFLEHIAKKSSFHRSVTAHYTFPRDPDDEPYINLAIDGKADYLVTRDNDLLDLMTDFDTTSKEFRQKTRPLKIVSPHTFLEIVRESLEAGISN